MPPPPRGSVLLEALIAAGLSDEILREAVLRGEAERDSATTNDPPTRGGFNAWAEGVRALRESLVPLGWTRDNSYGWPLTVTPCGKQAICVMTGNRFTGDQDIVPGLKYPKGPVVIAAIDANQLRMFPGLWNNPDQRLTWILLVHRANPDEVRLELSLPEVATRDGQVTAWQHRHFLAPLDLKPAPSDSDDETGSQDEVIDVPVSRKTP
jgi:hypothetical protein